MLPDGDLAVISDTGDMWLGDRAWVLCLWALREYRRWSYRLSQPLLLPLAQQVFSLLSFNRSILSSWLHLKSDIDLRDRLREVPLPPCQIRPR